MVLKQGDLKVGYGVSTNQFLQALQLVLLIQKNINFKKRRLLIVNWLLTICMVIFVQLQVSQRDGETNFGKTSVWDLCKSACCVITIFALLKHYDKFVQDSLRPLTLAGLVLTIRMKWLNIYSNHLVMGTNYAVVCIFTLAWPSWSWTLAICSEQCSVSMKPYP